MKHAAFNEFDMVAVKDKVSLFHKDSLLADYDDSKRDSGVVSIEVQHPLKRDSSYIIYEIHKTQIKKIFGKKNIWLVQILSQKTTREKWVSLGCCWGTKQVSVICEVDEDILSDYFNGLTLNQAFELQTTGSTK